MKFEGTTFETAPGFLGYEAAVAFMRARVEGIRAGVAGDMVWLVEHPPLYTAGTSAKAEDLKESGRFPTFEAGRGGQWTYHGPGQRVGYVMLDLLRAHGMVKARDVRGFVWGLEEWLIRTLAVFGVVGERRADRIGIWVVTGAEERKIGALGVRVTRWVSWHGVALNVCPDLSHFDGIVPCGIARHGVTSLLELGVSAGMKDVDEVLVRKFGEVFG